MTFYRHNAELSVHLFDCVGQVGLDTGLERLSHLQRELTARPAPDGVNKLLVDFRHTTWTSPEVHLKLARATRSWLTEFAEAGGVVRVAYLHEQQRGVASAPEAWFDDEAQALHWLTRVER